MNIISEALKELKKVESIENKSEWIEVASKQVPDSDGFNTDYTWYQKLNDDGRGVHIFMFGDKEIYEPDRAYADQEVEIYPGREAEAQKEAQDWFDNYKGFEDELDEDVKIILPSDELLDQDDNQFLTPEEIHGKLEDDSEDVWNELNDPEFTTSYIEYPNERIPDESLKDVQDDSYEAAELGGERIYCPDCGSKLHYDEDGAYCPDCRDKEVKDESLDEAKSETYPDLFKIINSIQSNLDSEYDILNPVTKEIVGSDIYYRQLVKTVEEAEKFNYHSDYWGYADSYQDDNVYAMTELEPYIGKVVSLNYEDEAPKLVKVIGLLIDKKYNSLTHTEILVEPIEDNAAPIENENLDEDYSVLIDDGDSGSIA